MYQAGVKLKWNCTLIFFVFVSPFLTHTQEVFSRGCVFRKDSLGMSIPTLGCNLFCNETKTVSICFFIFNIFKPEHLTGFAAPSSFSGQSDPIKLAIICLDQTPHCCKGFFGPDCSPCPGGYTTPCSSHGKVNPTYIHSYCTVQHFSGVITVFLFVVVLRRHWWKWHVPVWAQFQRITLPVLRRPEQIWPILWQKYEFILLNRDWEYSRYLVTMFSLHPSLTPACRCIHGVCDNHPEASGKCKQGSCKDGYTGEFCEQQTQSCGPNQPCHAHANCVSNNGAFTWVFYVLPCLREGQAQKSPVLHLFVKF